MSLGATERRELLDIVLPIAREAATLVLGGYRARPRAETKGEYTNLVTEFDRRSETLLRERLYERTGLFVVGEEHGSDIGSPGGSDIGGDLAFYVDPIDGTTNFVHGHPFYCVSIGLVERGAVPILGAVVAPSLHVEWTGALGVGAFRNGVECRVSEVERFENALLATGFPYDRRLADANFEAFARIKRRCQAVRRCGSAALDLCLVADGTYDGYWERHLGPWDVAGGSALVRAAGGRVTGFGGGETSVLSGEIVASNGAIHGALVAELA